MQQLLGVIMLAISCAPVGATEPERRVLVIGVDGLKPDAMAVADTPAIDGLIADGTYNDDAQCEDLTFSGPNWSTILHGVHRDKHGVISNSYEPSNLSGYPDLLAYVEAAHPDWHTARLSTWDMLHERQPTGADVNLFHQYADGGDDRVTDWAVELLLGDHPDAPGGPNAMAVYLGNVDIAGHNHGFHKSRRGYLDGIEVADAQIRRLVDAVRAREAASDEAWLIIMTSDHGGNIDGGHSGNTIDRRTIPFLVSGRLAAKGRAFPAPKNVDTVITALSYLGITLDDRLDGRPVGLEPATRPEPRPGSNLIFNGDAEFDRALSSAAFDQAVSGWHDPGPGMITTMAYGADGGWPTDQTPGAEDVGKNFFCAGNAPISEMTQSIDLGALSGVIRSGGASFELSGLLGGFGIQDDQATVRVEFLDHGGSTIASGQIGPVTAEDRRFETWFFDRRATGAVPADAVSARVTLRSVRRAGEASDGYADNLSLTISIEDD